MEKDLRGSMMPTGIPERSSVAFSVEQFRKSLLDGVELPKDLVTKTLKVLDAQLEAKKTIHFSHKGKVIEQRDVEDNGARLAAASHVLGMTGFNTRERTPDETSPGVILEIDPVTGVTRLVVGSTLQRLEPSRETRPSVMLSAREEPVQLSFPDVEVKSQEVEIVQTPQRLRDRESWKILCDEEVD